MLIYISVLFKNHDLKVLATLVGKTYIMINVPIFGEVPLTQFYKKN